MRVFAKQPGDFGCTGLGHGSLLPGEPLDRLHRLAGSAPAQKVDLLVFERVRGPEELLQLLTRPSWKLADILQIGFERRAIGNREHAIVAFLLAFAFA